MFNDTSKYVRTDVATYIAEIIALTSSEGVSPNFYPITNYLLSSSFMKTIGAVEQKILHIKWFLGFNHLESRYEIAKDLTRHSIAADVFEEAYKLFRKKILEFNFPQSDLSDNLWENEVCYRDANKKIIEVFNNSNIIHYTNEEYSFFQKCNPITVFDSLYEEQERLDQEQNSEDKKLLNTQSIEEIKKRYNITIANEKKLDVKTICNKIRGIFLKRWYGNTINHRHAIAHNLNAAKYNLPSIKSLASNEQYFENYYYRFLIVIYLDLILQKIFDNYLKIMERARL